MRAVSIGSLALRNKWSQSWRWRKCGGREPRSHRHRWTAKDLITREAKTIDITRVPLNFLPMTGKLDRGASGLSPEKGLCGTGKMTQLIKHLVWEQEDQSSDPHHPSKKKKKMIDDPSTRWAETSRYLEYTGQPS